MDKLFNNLRLAEEESNQLEQFNNDMQHERVNPLAVADTSSQEQLGFMEFAQKEEQVG